MALVPVGSTEPHGPHLPLATDAILSEEVCLRAARALTDKGRPTLVAPTITYGVTRYARGLPRGHLRCAPETLVALLTDVAARSSTTASPTWRCVNNHLEPEHAEAIDAPFQTLAGRARPAAVSFPNQLTRRWARTLTDEFKRGDCHAGRYETSLVPGRAPDLVRPTRGLFPTLAISLAAAIRAEGEVTFARHRHGPGVHGGPRRGDARGGREHLRQARDDGGDRDRRAGLGRRRHRGACRSTSMKITCVGGGPAGLYFAILMKKQDPAHEVEVYERNHPDDTFGFGVWSSPTRRWPSSSRSTRRATPRSPRASTTGTTSTCTTRARC